MRGQCDPQSSMFYEVNVETMIPAPHPRRISKLCGSFE